MSESSVEALLGFVAGVVIAGAAIIFLAREQVDALKRGAIQANAAHYAHAPDQKEGVFTWGPVPGSVTSTSLERRDQ